MRRCCQLFILTPNVDVWSHKLAAHEFAFWAIAQMVIRSKAARVTHSLLVYYCFIFGRTYYAQFLSDKFVRYVARMGEVRGAYNILVGRPEGRRPLGRPRRRGEDNIKMDLREKGFGDVDWIHWAQDRDSWRALVNTVMNLRVP
jgi:hypothetical protein